MAGYFLDSGDHCFILPASRLSSESSKSQLHTGCSGRVFDIHGCLLGLQWKILVPGTGSKYRICRAAMSVMKVK